MEKGYLIVHVYLNNKTNPVPGARVTITGENYQQSFITNEYGKTDKITLDTPLEVYSLSPKYKQKPYASYEVKVEKPGYNVVTYKNVEVIATETSLQDIILKKEPGKSEVIQLPEHCLWAYDCDSKAIAPDPYLNESNNLRVLPRVIIPEFIRVKNGTPTSSAAVLVVPFIDYIKNVTSSEIFSTWHVEAIKANVHAIVSFTLNRVFTEWYPSRGHNFTITAVPSHDQKFTPGRTIFQSISDVVDSYFNQFIQLNNTTHPFFAQYSDGRVSVHPGRLSQWGSQEMAQKGRSAIEILRHYYTPNLSLQTAEEIVGLPTSFPGFKIGPNSCGEYVLLLQNRLNRIRTNFPAIPVISPADGRWNTSTQNSVRTFQQVFNMPVTGTVDIATWLRITNLFVAVSGIAAGLRTS